MGKVLAAALAALLLFSGFEASGQQPTKPRSDGARLYVYRLSTLFGIANLDVPFIHLDGKRLTRIRIGGHLSVSVTPGQHKLTTTDSLFGSDTGKIRGQAIFAVPASTTLYLRYTEGFKSIMPIVLPKGAFVVSSGNYRFEAVPKSDALAEIANTQALELDRGKQ